MDNNNNGFKKGWATWQTLCGTLTFRSWGARPSWWWAPRRPSPPRSMSTTWSTGDYWLWLADSLILQQPCKILPSSGATWVPVGQRHPQVDWFVTLRELQSLKWIKHFRFSDKNQKAIDLLRTKCLKLKCMVSPFIENGCAASSQMAFPIFVHINVPLLVFIFVHIFVSIFVDIFQSLCDGKLYEIMRGNFERADRTSVIRTTVNSKVNINILSNISKWFQILSNISK